jgi:hypothetical protein
MSRRCGVIIFSAQRVFQFTTIAVSDQFLLDKNEGRAWWLPPSCLLPVERKAGAIWSRVKTLAPVARLKKWVAVIAEHLDTPFIFADAVTLDSEAERERIVYLEMLARMEAKEHRSNKLEPTYMGQLIWLAIVLGLFIIVAAGYIFIQNGNINLPSFGKGG